MDEFSKEIWKELLPAEREVAPTRKNVREAKDAAPQADHWTPAILLERAGYLRKLARAGDAGDGRDGGGRGDDWAGRDSRRID